jgi:hypothetical protein
VLSGFGFLLAGAVVWCLIGLLCVYAMFLIALSNIALAVLLALGPLFISMLVLRLDAQALLGMDRAARQLCARHHPDDHGSRLVAAGGSVLCGANRGARQRDFHRGCAAHDANRGSGAVDSATGDAHRFERRGRSGVDLLRDREPNSGRLAARGHPSPRGTRHTLGDNCRRRSPDVRTPSRHGRRSRGTNRLSSNERRHPSAHPAAPSSVNNENVHRSFREGVMRLLCFRSIPLAFIFLVGCARHDLRCDAHLTPINPPEPLAAPAHLKPSERGSP